MGGCLFHDDFLLLFMNHWSLSFDKWSGSMIFGMICMTVMRFILDADKTLIQHFRTDRRSYERMGLEVTSIQQAFFALLPIQLGNLLYLFILAVRESCLVLFQLYEIVLRVFFFVLYDLSNGLKSLLKT